MPLDAFYFAGNVIHFWFCIIVGLDSDYTVVSLALICSFSRMRKHLNLGDAKPHEVSQHTVQAVAQTLSKSESLKISEDGQFFGNSFISICIVIDFVFCE